MNLGSSGVKPVQTKSEDVKIPAISESGVVQSENKISKEKFTSESIASTKRQDYAGWEDFFMSVALLSSLRSKDPVQSTRMGACLVDPLQRVVGIGYNGFPRGCHDDELPWDPERKNAYVVRAEVNAILNKCSPDVHDCTLYVTKYPCNESAKIIIQSGIREVVHFDDISDEKDSDASVEASKIMFHMAGVKTRKFRLQRLNQIVLSLKPKDSNRSDKKVLDTEEKKVKSEIYHANATTVKEVWKKRTDYLSWDDYFMAMSLLGATRSKDPNTQVGACVVDHRNRIVGIGYNGFPRGCNDDELPWARKGGMLHTKYPYVTHAEVNALLNSGSTDVSNSTIYVALFPCNECAKVIIQSGVRAVVYRDDPYHDTDACRASRTLFRMAGVSLRRYTSNRDKLVLDLTK